MKVALVHDWLTGMRGGEKVLHSLCELFPGADLFTLFHVKGSVSPLIENRRIFESSLAKLPGARRFYRWLLPLYPMAIEKFDLGGYDLAISSSHCAAKGVIVPPDCRHISYVHTPMRYIWDLYRDYFSPQEAGILVSTAMSFIAPFLRAWDTASAARVGRFVANSRHVQNRIRRYYNRDAEVAHPPVDIGRFEPSAKIGDYDLVVSALVPYKRVDLAIRAAEITRRRLVIVGTGPLEGRLKKGANAFCEFAGAASDEEVARLMAGCRAFIFPGVEDFGITPVEAQAAGRPVVAFKKGGALETVIGADCGEAPDPRKHTGVFFDEQTPESLARAMRFAESSLDRFDAGTIRANAERFAPEIFKQKMKEIIDAEMKNPLTESGRA